MKRNGKNLKTSEYAANFSLSFDQSSSVTNLTLSVLRNVLTGQSGTQENPNVETQQPPISSESSLESIKKQPIFEYGEHVACVWYDDRLNCLRWYLGVADGRNNGEVLVSCIKVSDKKGLKWRFSDEAEIQRTKFDQILLPHLNVLVTVMIR